MPSPFSSPLLLVSLLLVPLLLPTHLLARPDGGHQHLNKDGAHKEGAHRGAHKKSAHRSAEIPIEEYEVGMKLCNTGTGILFTNSFKLTILTTTTWSIKLRPPLYYNILRLLKPLRKAPGS